MIRPVPVVLLICTLVAFLVTGEAQAVTPTDILRSLADNVLGAGMLTSVRVSNGGQIVLLRWQSPTLRAGAARETARGLLFSEAMLTTGWVMGRLAQVDRARFAIFHGSEMLATGENVRGRGVQLAFALRLGGGLYRRPQPGETSDTPRMSFPAMKY